MALHPSRKPRATACPHAAEHVLDVWASSAFRTTRRTLPGCHSFGIRIVLPVVCLHWKCPSNAITRTPARNWISPARRAHQRQIGLLEYAASLPPRAAPSILADHHGEVAPHDPVEVLRLHFHGQTVVDAVVPDLPQQVTRLATPHGTVGRSVVGFDQVVHHLPAILALVTLRVQLEQFVELFLAWIADFDLVRNPPQKGLVDQVVRLQIR